MRVKVNLKTNIAKMLRDQPDGVYINEKCHTRIYIRCCDKVLVLNDQGNVEVDPVGSFTDVYIPAQVVEVT